MKKVILSLIVFGIINFSNAAENQGEATDAGNSHGKMTTVPLGNEGVDSSAKLGGTVEGVGEKPAGEDAASKIKMLEKRLEAKRVKIIV